MAVSMELAVLELELVPEEVLDKEHTFQEQVGLDEDDDSCDGDDVSEDDHWPLRSVHRSCRRPVARVKLAVPADKFRLWC